MDVCLVGSGLVGVYEELVLELVHLEGVDGVQVLEEVLVGLTVVLE